MQSGIPYSTLFHILKSKSKSVTSENLLNICRGLNTPLKDFFDDPMFEFENISDD